MAGADVCVMGGGGAPNNTSNSLSRVNNSGSCGSVNNIDNRNSGAGAQQAGGGGQQQQKTPPNTPHKTGGKMLAVKILMLDDTYTLFQIQVRHGTRLWIVVIFAFYSWNL